MVAALSSLAAVAGLNFVSLQSVAAPANQAARPPGLTLADFSSELHDFAAAAALIQGLDLVISTDSAVVHLAGALGKPVWLLNHYNGSWRWLLKRDDSPWYPSLRQFRQRTSGDWSEVVGAVRTALHDMGDKAPRGNLSASPINPDCGRSGELSM
jgi:hypothetical protein